MASQLAHTDDPDGETPAEPWAMLLSESAKSYKAFCVFRDLPPGSRTLVAAYREVTGRSVARPPGRWSEWSRRNDWVRRANAWDDFQDARARTVALEARANDLHAMRDAGGALLEGGLRRLQWLLEHSPEKVSATAAVRAVEVGHLILRDAVVLPVPRGDAATSGLVDDLVETYGALALSGDREAAKVVLAAAERKAAAEGTDAPQRHVGVVATLQEVLGGWSPDDIPAHLQAQIVAHLESQEAIDAPEAPE